jgi:hypothetical protein
MAELESSEPPLLELEASGGTRARPSPATATRRNLGDDLADVGVGRGAAQEEGGRGGAGRAENPRERREENPARPSRVRPGRHGRRERELRRRTVLAGQGDGWVGGDGEEREGKGKK